MQRKAAGKYLSKGKQQGNIYALRMYTTTFVVINKNNLYFCFCNSLELIKGCTSASAPAPCIEISLMLPLDLYFSTASGFGSCEIVITTFSVGPI